MFTAGFSLGEVPLLWSQIDQMDLFGWHCQCKEGIKGVFIEERIWCYIETWCSLAS